MPTRVLEFLDRALNAIATSFSLILLLLVYWPYTLTLKFKHVLH
jgi:hypothetical protein